MTESTATTPPLPSSFPAGLVVFFRLTNSAGVFFSESYPLARDIAIDERFLSILDAAGQVIDIINLSEIIIIRRLVDAPTGGL